MVLMLLNYVQADLTETCDRSLYPNVIVDGVALPCDVPSFYRLFFRCEREREGGREREREREKEREREREKEREREGERERRARVN